MCLCVAGSCWQRASSTALLVGGGVGLQQRHTRLLYNASWLLGCWAKIDAESAPASTDGSNHSGRFSSAASPSEGMKRLEVRSCTELTGAWRLLAQPARNLWAVHRNPFCVSAFHFVSYLQGNLKRGGRSAAPAI